MACWQFPRLTTLSPRFSPTGNPNMSGYVQYANRFTQEDVNHRMSQQFGLEVMDQQGPLSIDARVLSPPTLQYGGQGRGSTVVRRLPDDVSQSDRRSPQTPRDGAWNMVDKKFYRPSTIERWCVAIYERQQWFGDRERTEMVRELLKVCASVGEFDASGVTLPSNDITLDDCQE